MNKNLYIYNYMNKDSYDIHFLTAYFKMSVFISQNHFLFQVLKFTEMSYNLMVILYSFVWSLQNTLFIHLVWKQGVLSLSLLLTLLYNPQWYTEPTNCLYGYAAQFPNSRCRSTGQRQWGSAVVETWKCSQCTLADRGKLQPSLLF